MQILLFLYFSSGACWCLSCVKIKIISGAWWRLRRIKIEILNFFCRLSLFLKRTAIQLVKQIYRSGILILWWLIKGKKVRAHLWSLSLIARIEIELILFNILLNWSWRKIESCIWDSLLFRSLFYNLRLLYGLICFIITSYMLFTLLFSFSITFYIFCHFSIIVSWKSHSATTASWCFKRGCRLLDLLSNWSHLRSRTWLSKCSILWFNFSSSRRQINFRQLFPIF